MFTYFVYQNRKAYTFWILINIIAINIKHFAEHTGYAHTCVCMLFLSSLKIPADVSPYLADLFSSHFLSYARTLFATFSSATRHKFVNNISLWHNFGSCWMAKLLVSSNYLTHSTLRICAISSSFSRAEIPNGKENICVFVFVCVRVPIEVTTKW